MTETIPGQTANPQLADYLEIMSRAVFQAGLRWSGIAAQWDSYREAFASFDPDDVSNYGEGDVDRIMHTPGVLRSVRKIRAVIQNAQTLVELDRRYAGFQNYLRSFGDYASLSKDIRRRFSFMGEMNVWYFLFRVCEPVPKFEDWVDTIPGEHPRMREMVERARAAGTSTEY